MIRATVTVTVNLKVNKDTRLQAFDLYVENDEKLEFAEFSSANFNADQNGAAVNAQRITVGSTSSTGTVQHIQLIGTDTGKRTEYSIQNAQTVALCTLTFRVLDSVIYNEQLPITIRDGANIAVGNTDNNGDPTSYYPTIERPVLGVETLKTYTVTFITSIDNSGVHDASAARNIENWPADSVKQHNVAFPVPGVGDTEDQVGRGFYRKWCFNGWTLDTWVGGATYLPREKNQVVSANVNRDIKLYAYWGLRATFRVTYHNGDNSVLQDFAERYSGAPVPALEYGKTPTKAQDNENTYTFANLWTYNGQQYTTEQISAMTVNSNMDFYPVFNSTQNEYSVVYTSYLDDSENVTGIPERQNGLHWGDLVSEPQGIPTAQHYDFAYWAINDGAETQWRFNIDRIGDRSEGLSFRPLYLHAKWTPKNYSITYIQNGGEWVGVAPDSTYTYNVIKVLPDSGNISKPGYTFGGWYDNEELTGQPVTQLTAGEEGNKTFYAKWTPVSYTVTFNENGGSDVEDINYTIEDTITIPATAKTGYTFNGWKVITAAGNWTADGMVDPGTLSEKYGNVTLTAQFSPIGYTVRFHANGGTGTMEDQSFDYDETKNLTSNSFTSQGRTFKGWSTTENPALNADVDFHDSASVSNLATTNGAVVDLYAVWTSDAYSITYNLGINATNGSGNPTTYNVDQTPINLADPSRPGYTFTGWTVESAQIGKVNLTGDESIKRTIPAGTIGNLTVTANWVVNSYTITYNANGGSPVNAQSYEVETDVTLGTTTRDGYTFTGWKLTAADDLQNWGTVNTTVITDTAVGAGKYGSITLTAQWTAKEYTIHFVTDQGLRDEKYKTTDDKTLYDFFHFDVNPGHTFDGWKATAVEGTWELNNVYETGFNVLNQYGDVTLTALFNTIEYTITYELDGGTVNGTNPETYTVESDNITLVNPTKLGYTFVGWSGTGLTGENNTTVTISSGSTGNRSYTANWTKDTYNITYSGVEGATFTASNPVTYQVDTPDITLTNPEKKGYNFLGWSGTDLTGTANTAVTITTGSTGDRAYTANWEPITYHVRYYKYPVDVVPNEVLPEGDKTYTIEDQTDPTDPEVPDKPGYDKRWRDHPIDHENPTNINVYPEYTPHVYTITFNPDGGAAIAVDNSNGINESNKMTYTIESGYTLPVTTKGLFQFKGWKVTTAGGNWEADTLVNNGTAVTGKYGDVTLTAQWAFPLTLEVEEYKYAASGYRMLRIDADGLEDGEIYSYGGTPMYYTEDENYQIGDSTGVFYTLILAASDSLTVEQYGSITKATGVRKTINYNGDVNADGTINIADANTIFQMLSQSSYGGYYSNAQLSVEQRLACDLVRATANADHRGSIEDVNYVVNIVNGRSNG